MWVPRPRLLRRPLPVVGALLLLLAAGRPSRAQAPAIELDVVFQEIPGIDVRFTSLDVTHVPDASCRPIFVYVHGGGWQGGDKRNVASKPLAAVLEGYVFFSVNYRLAWQAPFPAAAEDVATAIAWIRRHARQYGGDPTRIVLMGHSAGAHLVSLVATDESLLAAQGLSPADVESVVSLDTLAYELSALADPDTGLLPEPYRTVFGDDPEDWAAASPRSHVDVGEPLPTFVLVHSGGTRPGPNARRREATESFASALRAAGAAASVHDASDKTHDQLNEEFGAAGDWVAEASFEALAEVSPPPPPGEASDVRRGAAPFLLRSSGGSISLRWARPGPAAPAGAYRLLALPLSGSGAAEPIAVLGTTTEAVVSGIPADSGLLVVPCSCHGSGSPGDGSDGVPRDVGRAAACP